jgi:hypothetical protein
LTTPTSTGPSSAPHKNGRSFLERAANLSTVLTLIALIGIGATAQGKLDAIDRKGTDNCRAINTGILLTLESSPRADLSARQESNLDRTIARFQRLADRC